MFYSSDEKKEEFAATLGELLQTHGEEEVQAALSAWWQVCGVSTLWCCSDQH